MDKLTTAQSWDDIWTRGMHGPARPTTRDRWATSWRHVLSELLSHAPPGGSVLELGCAPGSMIVNLHTVQPDLSYRGIDYAPAGLDLCRRTTKTAGIDVDLTLGDITRTDLPVAPADLVVSFGLIEHFEDPAEAIGYHVQLTRPGGWVGVTVPNYSHPVVQALLRRFSPDTLETHNTTSMHVDRIDAAMRRAGLVEVTSGETGGPILPNGRATATIGGRGYRQAARAWNLAAGRALPATWPWSAIVWATGRRPSIVDTGSAPDRSGH